MSTHRRTIVGFHCFDIHFLQPVVTATVVAIERERLELFEHSGKPLSGRALVVREPELVRACRFDMVEFVVACAQSIDYRGVDRRLF